MIFRWISDRTILVQYRIFQATSDWEVRLKLWDKPLNTKAPSPYPWLSAWRPEVTELPWYAGCLVRWKVECTYKGHLSHQFTGIRLGTCGTSWCYWHEERPDLSRMKCIEITGSLFLLEKWNRICHAGCCLVQFGEKTTQLIWPHALHGVGVQDIEGKIASFPLHII